MTDKRDIHEAVLGLVPEAQNLLCELIAFPSTSGREQELMLLLYERLRKLEADVSKVEISDSIRDDPDYSDPISGVTYGGRFNLRLVRKGTGGGRSLLLNTHTDVVPPSEGMQNPWSPRVEDGAVWGRGACDAKGQVATVFLVLKALDVLKARLRGDVLVHLVVEEENGGNGSLAMARRGEQADGCVVLEPSGSKLFTSIRGAVWFRLVLSGKAGHSGAAGVSRSALLMARDAIGVLERYQADLLAGSRGLPLFDAHPNPMPITFGRLEAGTWHATAPSRAVLEGVLGLLPNKTKEQVCDEMRQTLVRGGDEFFARNFDLRFVYRHDSSVLDPEHELPQGMLKAARATGAPLEIDAMTASCDAWFYNNILGIPTVVCGPGTLGVCHSAQESIEMQDIAGAAETLLTFLFDYCGEGR